MEINPCTTEKSDCQKQRSSDEQGLGQARSYQCNFCEKGFSNAQALGGHMNIHRKDRAKLRECLDETLLSMDFTRKDLSHDDKSLKLPWIFSREEDHDVVPRDKNGILEFPLFVDKPLISSALEGSNHVSEHAEKVMQSSHAELDLELRLWPRAS